MCCSYIYEKENGCLYMGDYDAAGKAEWEELQCAYGDYWKFIGCIQIPHHGSQYDFNEEFLRMDAYFIISCGYSNKYHHPHAKVMKLFLVNHIMPYIVTEQVGSSVYLLINRSSY